MERTPHANNKNWFTSRRTTQKNKTFISGQSTHPDVSAVSGLSKNDFFSCLVNLRDYRQFTHHRTP